jgi:hypothetical protein
MAVLGQRQEATRRQMTVLGQRQGATRRQMTVLGQRQGATRRQLEVIWSASRGKPPTNDTTPWLFFSSPQNVEATL